MGVRTKDVELDNVYFVTFTVKSWCKVFTTKQRCELFIKWFDYQRVKYGNKLHGFVIMPNHFHALIYVSKKSPKLPILIMNAKRFLAYGLSKKLSDKELNMFRVSNKKVKHQFFNLAMIVS